MNKKFNTTTAISAIAAAVIIGGGGLVLAHGGTHPESEAHDKSAQVAQAEAQKTPEQLAKELSDRLLKRKDEIKPRLNTAEKTRLQSRCKNSQGLLSSLEGRIKGVETSRNEVYPHTVTRLTELSAKLKAKGADTTKLDADIKTLEGKIAEFKTNLADYKQSVADLSKMNCQQDPDSFKASLEKARALRQKLKDSGAEIKTFIKDTLKPDLAAIRATLSKEETNGTDGGTE